MEAADSEAASETVTKRNGAARLLGGEVFAKSSTSYLLHTGADFTFGSTKIKVEMQPH